MAKTEKQSLTNRLLLEAADAFSPIASIDSPAKATALLNELGWELPGAEFVASVLPDLYSQVESIANLVSLIGKASPEERYALLDDLAIGVSDLAQSIISLKSKLESAFNDLSPQLLGELIEDLPPKLFDYLIVTYLERHSPFAFGFLLFLDVIQITEDNMKPAADPPRTYKRQKIDWEKIPEIVSDPVSLAKRSIGWLAESDLLYQKLFECIELLLLSLHVPYGYYTQEERKKQALEKVSDDKELRMPIYQHGTWPGAFVEMGLNLSKAFESEGVFKGLALLPYLSGTAEVELTLCPQWKFSFQGSLQLDNGIALLLKPLQGFRLKTNLLDEPAEAVQYGLKFKFFQSRRNGDGTLIFGSEEGPKISVSGFSVSIDVNNQEEGRNEFRAELNIDEVAIILSSEDADSFINKMLPKGGIEARFDLGMGWSSLEGLYFRGSAALEIVLPISRKIGPIDLKSIYCRLTVDGKDIPIILGASFNGQIGPVSASVEKLGLEFSISIKSNNDGNFGPIQIDAPRFVPPLGAGLAIEAGPVTGGGYLEFDNDNKRYTGILQLSFGEIGLVAIGLITTRMPDGSKGFSMLVIIGVEFDPPITLPYNFNLSGVGGLIGIQRSMNVEYLRNGLRAGTLDSVLFPKNPIQNAARIISDLRAGFPPAKERYLVGPMAIIGWGSPQIITAEIGIFIEVPSPLRIAILGQFTAQLPNAKKSDDTIVVIHLDVLGVLDFDKESFSLDASIYDSRILAFSLSGDMAMRVLWGNNPYFLVSFGGYNPKFKIRPGMPRLRRLLLSIGKGDNPRISLDCYLALTSNTTQFGAKLELIARKAGFKVHGYLYFNALFIFSPFSFLIDMGAGVEVYRGSRCLFCISLSFALSGPTPWRAKGTAKFNILFVKIKIRFDKSWGKRKSASLPAADAWPLLKGALEDPGTWSGLLPEAKEQVVRIRKLQDRPEMIVVYFGGKVKISQKVVPFNLTLQKFGNGPVAGDSRYAVSAVLLNGTPLENPIESGQLSYGKQFFAKAQFRKMSDAEKLSRPSFEKEDADIIVGTDELEIDVSSVRSYDLVYETEVIDENKVSQSLGSTPMIWKIAAVLVKGRARRRGVPAGRKFRDPSIEPLVRLKEEQYKVVTKNTLSVVAESVGSYSQAQSLADGFVAEHPKQAGNVQIVSEYETVA